MEPAAANILPPHNSASSAVNPENVYRRGRGGAQRELNEAQRHLRFPFLTRKRGLKVLPEVVQPVLYDGVRIAFHPRGRQRRGEKWAVLPCLRVTLRRSSPAVAGGEPGEPLPQSGGAQRESNEAQRHPHFLFLFFASALLRVPRGESRPFWLSAERSAAALGHPRLKILRRMRTGLGKAHAAAVSSILPAESTWSNLTATRLLTPCSCIVTP